ncbi:MarR family winged helix-turn-helix transcriptional regulator [Catenuloplanes sp. NPDC051500]|uniref:MarR family winged helix-turn-helix transcriptional regulator n=1 Tax=Catenuloplanes sp. NPDC051500 TaxID=3363959 RepID=UPI0037A336B6
MTDDERLYGTLDPTTLAVRDLIGASRQLVGRMAHVMGMNPNDMSAIDALTRNGPMGVAELADRLGIRSASATVMVDRLERAGHVARTRDGTDRRRVTVTETETARQVTQQVWGPVITAIDQACRDLPEPDRETVRRFLTHLTDVALRAAQ